jgi:hypothetical protein
LEQLPLPPSFLLRKGFRTAKCPGRPAQRHLQEGPAFTSKTHFLGI